MKIKAVVLAGLLAVSGYSLDKDLGGLHPDEGIFAKIDLVYDDSLLLGIADGYCIASIISQTEEKIGKDVTDIQIQRAIGSCIDDHIPNIVKIEPYFKRRFKKDSYIIGRKYGEKIFYEINNE